MPQDFFIKFFSVPYEIATLSYTAGEIKFYSNFTETGHTWYILLKYFLVTHPNFKKFGDFS